MRSLFLTLVGLLLLVAAIVPAAGEQRLALVIGNAHYKEAPLATPLNDAGLVAQCLRQAGFDVTAAADLDQQTLRHTLRDFVARVQQAGPDSIIFVYLSGRGLQYAGENYFVPVDAVVEREADVPIANVRLSDYLHALATIPAKARIFVLDVARYLHFATEGYPFASGLAMVDPEPGSLYAVNAAPGTIGLNEPGPYGVYAKALVAAMREGVSIDQVFAETRLRVNQLTDGSVVPWEASKVAPPIFLFTRAAGAPPSPDFASQEAQSLNGMPAAQAYTLVVERDSLAGYGEFLKAYPRDPLALRVRALRAARREALTWFRAVAVNTPEAYWTYMRRYPHGPHFADARRRLATLAAPLDPPPRFAPYDFGGLPPPTEDEYVVIDRPVLIFNDPSYPPPPPVPTAILPLWPVEFEHLPPPEPGQPGSLPVPAAVSPQYAKPLAQPSGITLGVSPTESGSAQPKSIGAASGLPPEKTMGDAASGVPTERQKKLQRPVVSHAAGKPATKHGKHPHGKKPPRAHHAKAKVKPAKMKSEAGKRATKPPAKKNRHSPQ